MIAYAAGRICDVRHRDFGEARAAPPARRSRRRTPTAPRRDRAPAQFISAHPAGRGEPGDGRGISRSCSATFSANVARATGSTIQRRRSSSCRRTLHDLYLLAEDRRGGPAAAIIRSGIAPAAAGRSSCFRRNSDSDSDARAVAAGAADYLPLDDLTPSLLERSIRHALVRQQGIARARAARSRC